MVAADAHEARSGMVLGPTQRRLEVFHALDKLTMASQTLVGRPTTLGDDVPADVSVIRPESLAVQVELVYSASVDQPRPSSPRALRSAVRSRASMGQFRPRAPAEVDGNTTVDFVKDSHQLQTGTRASRY